MLVETDLMACATANDALCNARRAAAFTNIDIHQDMSLSAVSVEKRARLQYSDTDNTIV